MSCALATIPLGTEADSACMFSHWQTPSQRRYQRCHAKKDNVTSGYYPGLKICRCLYAAMPLSFFPSRFERGSPSPYLKVRYSYNDGSVDSKCSVRLPI